MRWLGILFTTAALADPAPRPLPWFPITEWFYTPSQARLYGPNDYSDPEPWNAIYVRAHVSDPYGPQSTGVWHHFDLKPLGVGQDAKVAFLTGLLIITRGTTTETADVRVTFRTPGDNTADCSKYIGQALEAIDGSGQRSNMSTLAPLKNGEGEFCFQFNTNGIYPANSSYGINLSVQAWGR